MTPEEFLDSEGAFFASLFPAKYVFDERDAVQAHDTVLRPLLENATVCWAYGIEPDSEVARSAGNLLQRSKGKWRVLLDSEPIVGHEFFWNASSGARGSIVILIPLEAIPWMQVASHLHQVSVMSNYRVAHTLSAIRFARQQVAIGDTVGCCLSRNNGLGWMHVLAQPKIAKRLYEEARGNRDSQGPTKRSTELPGSSSR